MANCSQSTIMPFMATMFLLVVYSAEAFTAASSSLRRTSLMTMPVVPSSFRLRASSENGGGDDLSSSAAAAGLPPLPSQGGVTTASKVAERSAVTRETTGNASVEGGEEEEEMGSIRSYPIDLPSPLLLATSMILAISSTGSIFELAGGGSTKLGFGPTAALAAMGMPMSIFLIYAAIMKGAAETEEDDKEYNRPRRL